VIHVGTLTHRKFSTGDIELLQVVAQRVSLALDRALVHERLVQLTQVQREFVALAAHELRSPTVTIYGIAATLHLRQRELAPDVVDELLLNLYQQSARMRRLVEQLLDLSRLDAAAVAVEPRRVALRAQIQEIVGGVAAIDQRAVRVAVPDDLEVFVDPATIEHVVANLVSNAMRYGRPPIVVSAEQSDRHVRILVEDSGEGVSPEFVPYLFERFRRSDDASAMSLGTGLGLSIARSYARAHGGDVLYHGDARGAKFELVVPAPPVTD
jgi:two-component system sensor histidine kinase MtrB